jgi:hypothetical protein
MELKYTKIRQTKQLDEHTTEITRATYTDKPHSVTTEITKTIPTDGSNLLKDTISCLEIITRGESRRLIIEVQCDPTGEPVLVTKTWMVNKEIYGK